MKKFVKSPDFAGRTAKIYDVESLSEVATIMSPCFGGENITDMACDMYGVYNKVVRWDGAYAITGVVGGQRYIFGYCSGLLY